MKLFKIIKKNQYHPSFNKFLWTNYKSYDYTFRLLISAVKKLITYGR